MTDVTTARLTVRAEWDPEARVWIAESDDVPRLVTEADTIELLIERMQRMVPQLEDLNGAGGRDFPFELVTLEGDGMRARSDIMVEKFAVARARLRVPD